MPYPNPRPAQTQPRNKVRATLFAPTEGQNQHVSVLAIRKWPGAALHAKPFCRYRIPLLRPCISRNEPRSGLILPQRWARATTSFSFCSRAPALVVSSCGTVSNEAVCRMLAKVLLASFPANVPPGSSGYSTLLDGNARSEDMCRRVCQISGRDQNSEEEDAAGITKHSTEHK